ncbi:hypothetical protein H4Q26_016051 [Puccinia striiformis f. sp. tritici PST-130]|nr:hypothetical protein H4Q26_016051 [Puccinia striiformis f. sp. tritici PST-130]
MTYFGSTTSYLRSISGLGIAHVLCQELEDYFYSDFQPGQKEWKLARHGIRRASDTIGWVGSKFLTRNKAIGIPVEDTHIITVTSKHTSADAVHLLALARDSTPSTASYFKIQEKKMGDSVAEANHMGESVSERGFSRPVLPVMWSTLCPIRTKSTGEPHTLDQTPGGYHDGNLPSSSNLPGPIVYSEYRRRRSLRSPSKSKTAKTTDTVVALVIPTRQLNSDFLSSVLIFQKQLFGLTNREETTLLGR